MTDPYLENRQEDARDEREEQAVDRSEPMIRTTQFRDLVAGRVRTITEAECPWCLERYESIKAESAVEAAGRCYARHQARQEGRR